MKAEYNNWYKCQEGQMPEDFEDCLYQQLLVRLLNKDLAITQRVPWNGTYKWLGSSIILQWMLPEPYKK